MTTHPFWRDEAACIGGDLNDWFPDGTGVTVVIAEKRAKKVCSECPVRLTCLEAAMSEEADNSDAHRFGVFGGLNPRERAKLAKQQDQAAS